MDKNEKLIYNLLVSNYKICIDSRHAKKNSIFFSLKGENFDGNHFAELALKNGCEYAVVDNNKLKPNDKLIFVPNVLQALQNMASYHRSKISSPVIAITGTNGKTTTKELVYSVLAKKYKTFFTEGNYNNHIGVPITILSVKEDAEIVVVELGANHKGEIWDLCHIAKPTHGIITNIGKAHLEGFEGVDGVIKAKNELYKYIKNQNGKVFVNNDDDLLMDLSKEIKRISYGKSENSDFIGEEAVDKNSLFLKLHFYDNNRENKTLIETNLFGQYNFYNVMAAVSVGSYFGVDKADIKNAIENYMPKNNRSQVIDSDNNMIIMDAYNANPSSMVLAIDNFVNRSFSNKVVILGDMLELGDETQKEHERIYNLVKPQNFDKIIFVGKAFKDVVCNNEQGDVLSFDYVNEVIEWLKNKPIMKSAVLLKASRGIKLEKLLEYL